MNIKNEAKISGDMGDDLMRACQNAQQINLNGHTYVITFVDKTSEPALIRLKRFPSGDQTIDNGKATYRYSGEALSPYFSKKKMEDPYLVIDQGKDDRLIDLVKSFRDSISDGNIKMLNEKKYIQTVINLAEGLPASKVAESRDKAAEYVRNQDTQGYWDEDID